MMLDLNGIESEGAFGCDEAEARIAAEFFPIILSDLRMRGEEDGFRLIDAVRRISPRSRVAAMTGYADAATEARLRERGAHLVLRKPLHEEELMAALPTGLPIGSLARLQPVSFGTVALATHTNLPWQQASSVSQPGPSGATASSAASP